VKNTTYRGISRSRKLTKAEAARYLKIRQQVADEIPPAKASLVNVALAKLRAMREAKGMSLEELASRMGMTPGNLTRLESRKNATLRTLERYAAGLDCELEISVVSTSVAVTQKRAAKTAGDS
jgi:DNA-binding Xre family transcriptional regulator